MADPVAPVVTPPALVAAPPVPVVAAEPTPAPQSAPVAATPVAPVAPAAPAAPAPTDPTATSLLSEPAKPPVEPAKPVEAAPIVEPAKPEPPKPSEPAPAPVFEAFKLPDGVELDKAEVGKFTELLGKFEIENKADHAKLQAFGQELINQYIAEMNAAQQRQIQSWTRTRDEWKAQFLNDPELGGRNQQQTLSRCAAMIDQYGGTAEQQKELRAALAITGMGDHPAMIRFVNAIGKVLSEPKTTAVGKQVAATALPKSQRRYAGSLNGANGAN